MNEWKFQMRRRVRGRHCLIHTTHGGGHRTPPPKAEKVRIVKRELARQLREEVRAMRVAETQKAIEEARRR